MYCTDFTEDLNFEAGEREEEGSASGAERGLLRGSSFFPGIVVVIRSDMSPNSAF